MDIYDINYRILQQQHPYYSAALCETNVFIRESCEESKYDLLQLWCFPEKSVKELKDLYPNLTFGDVIEMSLVYHPIPESRGKYDDLTLFYHSCRIRQAEPTIFIPQIILEDSEVSYAIMFICYKYNRIDALEYWRDNASVKGLDDFFNIMINTIRSKLGITKYEDLIYLPTSYYSSQDIMRSSMLFDKEELLELCLNLANGGSYYMEITFGTRNDPAGAEFFTGLDTFIDTLVANIGNDRALSIIKRYRPNFTNIENVSIGGKSSHIMKLSVLSKDKPFEYNIVKANRDKSTKLRAGLKYLTTAQAMFHLSLVEDALTDDQLAMYYITTGRFDKYILWKHTHGSITKAQEENANRFAAPNLYGIISLNNELSHLLNIDLSMMNPKSTSRIENLSKMRGIPVRVYIN